MQADLLQQQREAENLSDEELLYYAQNGSPHISSLIITQVMADRAQQRQAGAAAAPPSPTVKDQVAQQLASSSQFPGITSIEQPQMATYSGGGILGYADGGLVGYHEGGEIPPHPHDSRGRHYGPESRLVGERPEWVLPGSFLDKTMGYQDAINISRRDFFNRSVDVAKDIFSLPGTPSERSYVYGVPNWGVPQLEPREASLPARYSYEAEEMAPDGDLTRQLLASGKLDEIPVAGMGDIDGLNNQYKDLFFGGGLSYDPITARTMEEPDLDARFAGIRDMVEELADPTAGEVLRDQQRRGMSKELAGRRLRSQELQGMEARSEPWRYAADIAFGREGPTLREGITSIITEREAEQDAISDNMFAMRDAIAEAQAQRERGAVGVATQLESEIAKLGVETAFDVAKFNASEENRAAIANLEAEIRTGIANNDASARQTAALLEASATANPTDLVEVVRAINSSIQNLVGGQSILVGAGLEVPVEDLVSELVGMLRGTYGQIGQQVFGEPQTIGPNTISRPSGPA